MKDYPLLVYAAKDWGIHAREVQNGVQDRTLKFPRNETDISSSVRMILNPSDYDKITGLYFPVGMSASHLCAFFGLEGILNSTLDETTETSLQDNYGRTPLSWAAENGHDSVVQFLLKRENENINLRGIYHPVLTIYLAKGGRTSIWARQLKGDTAKMRTKDRQRGRTPLSYAAKNGHEIILRLLLDREGLEVNSQDEFGWTPLSLAIQHKHRAAAQLLLEHDNIYADLKDEMGRTPLSYAAQAGYGELSCAAEAVYREMVQLLLQHDDVETDSQDESGCTPLFHAAWNGCDRIVQLLLTKDNIQPDLQNRDGMIPLAQAAKEGHHVTVKLLLQRDDINARLKDNVGRTPFVHAMANKNRTTAQVLWSQDRNELVDMMLDKYDLSRAEFEDRYGKTRRISAQDTGIFEINTSLDILYQLLVERGNAKLDQLSLDFGGPTPAYGVHTMRLIDIDL